MNNQFQPMGIDWNGTLGKMVTNTTTVAGLLTASPIYGPMGRLNGKGIIVSIAVGSALALMGKKDNDDPLLCYGEHSSITNGYHDDE
ncbi:hypothetical protein HC723_10100 [Vibrio sp. S11_S32]|uniref:hypothetical protein n=1 Tax=Vibrio sp. S11_S32 TaxID=2720225 RepID=UPI001681558E|nr:hypothetical protein [Vibrio sp. S11_S32]MBD1576787.1 hypothetical protein [Vibrio sp. S11_S32]